MKSKFYTKFCFYHKWIFLKNISNTEYISFIGSLTVGTMIFKGFNNV